PCAAMRSTKRCPMPLPPPVTSATLPRNVMLPLLPRGRAASSLDHAEGSPRAPLDRQADVVVELGRRLRLQDVEGVLLVHAEDLRGDALAHGVGLAAVLVHLDAHRAAPYAAS